MGGHVSAQPLDFPCSESGILDLILRIPPETGLNWKLTLVSLNIKIYLWMDTSSQAGSCDYLSGGVGMLGF